MPRIKYQDQKFKAPALALIEQANTIIAEYQAQGFELTLRQLYYQFVARDLIPNTMKSYKALGSVVNDGRLAGLIDWDAIVDRTRNLVKNPHWNDARHFMDSVIPQFATDKWHNQENRVEVWIEKDALAGVIERVCRSNDVPFFSCRGYTSQSEMWSAAMRLRRYSENGQTPVIIHLGDHDPSGIDMSADIERRMELFMGGLEVKRIALNMDQVEKYDPPPNPAKITDTRAKSYIRRFGHESWELDALEPRVLEKLIEKTIHSLRDDDQWSIAEELEEEQREALEKVSKKL